MVSRLLLMPLAPRFGMPVLSLIACALQGLGMLAMPLVASSFGALQFASIMAVLTVLVSLARSGSPLLGSLLSDWRMVVVSGALSLVAAVLLVPIARRSRATGEYEADPAPVGAPAVSAA